MAVAIGSARGRIALSGSIAALAWSVSVAGAQVVSAAEDPALAKSAVAIPVAMPTTEPAPTPVEQTRPDPSDTGNFRGRGWFGQPHPDGRMDFPSPNEWQNVSAFMKEHSPRRWAFYSSLPDGHRKSGMMLVATRSYRSLLKAQQDDPALAAVIVQRVEAEDAVFADVTELRQTKKSDDGGNTQMLSRDLREKVAALVDIGFKERQMRIDQLQKTLDDLKTRLASDQKNRESVISDRVHSAVGGQRLTAPNEPSSDATHADVLPPATVVEATPTR